LIINTLGFGGASLTSMKSYEDVKSLLNHAYDLGIRHFDTAPLYGKGYSELIYGAFLKDKRKEITLATKFGLGEFYTNKLPIQLLLPMNYYLKTIKNSFKKTPLFNDLKHTPIVYRQINKSEIESSFKASIKRLNTDYLDYYLLHEGLPHFLTDEALYFLLKLKQTGAIRFIGIGTNISDIKQLTIKELEHWDVLQYEGRNQGIALEIRHKFFDKMHFHHSCIKKIDPLSIDPKNESIGHQLAQSVLNNLDGKVIFSTRHKDYLNTNINEFLKTM
jgi:aryl-alcohol dehydrogenase-like predicted oxidoreductase